MSGVLARETAVRKICNRVGFSYDRLVYPQLAAGARSVSTQQAFDLVALATAARHDTAAMAYLLKNDGTFSDFRTALAGTSFLEKLDRFLDEYGHRGRYESDWALPRMHENPAAVLFAIREQLHARTQDPKAISERQTADANAAWRAFEAHLTWWQRWTILPQARALIRRLKKQYGWREQVRSDLTRILRYMRGYHLALAAAVRRTRLVGSPRRLLPAAAGRNRGGHWRRGTRCPAFAASRRGARRNWRSRRTFPSRC